MRSIGWSTWSGVFLVIIVLAGAALHTIHIGEQRNQSRLQTIALINVRQFAAWLGERDGQADLVRAIPLFTQLYQRWSRAQDSTGRDFLLNQLLAHGRHTGFSDAILWDLRSNRAWSARGDPPVFEADALQAAWQSLRTGKVQHCGPYPVEGGGARLDFLAPAPDRDDQRVIVMRMDPREQLSSSLLSWPLSDLPGRIELLRRAGDEVLVFGVVPDRLEGGGIRRLSLASLDGLFARVFHGPREQGEILQGEILQGVDASGVPSVGAVASIPGTDWWLMSMVEHDDFLAMSARNAPWLLLVGILGLTVLAITALFLRQREMLIASRREREIQSERLRALELLNAIVESSAEGIFARDLEGRYLLFNPALCALLGKTPEEVRGRHYRTLYPPSMVGDLEDIERRILDENRVFTDEEVHQSAMGQLVLLVTRGPLHDASGRIIGTFGIARDFTDRKRAEVALQERLAMRDQLASIVASVPGAIYSLLIRPDGSGCIPFSTPRVEDLYGISQAELARDLDVLRSGVHPEDVARIDAILCHPPADAASVREVFRYRHPTKGRRWIEGWAIPKLEQGDSILWHGFFMDVTDRVVAEEALRESEERYRLLFERSSEALIVVDPEEPWRIIRANPAAVAMFQALDAADFISRSFWDYSPPEQDGGVPSVVRANEVLVMAMRLGACVFDWLHRRLDGQVFPATVRVTRFELAGKPVFQSSIRDITHRKRQEHELISSRAKLRELTAYREKAREDERAYIAREIHDDLGQYLTALRMETNLMGMLLGEEAVEASRRLASMKGLIDHLIAETRRVIARLRPVALDLGLVSAAEWLAADYRGRLGIACDLEVVDAEELDLDGDQATTLFRILQECLTNVTLHAHARRVGIRIAVCGELLRMEVRDDGQGFDPVAVRGKKTFGLMGIRERVLIYGGSARIDSQIGSGTLVTIELPIKPRGDA